MRDFSTSLRFMGCALAILASAVSAKPDSSRNLFSKPPNQSNRAVELPQHISKHQFVVLDLKTLLSNTRIGDTILIRTFDGRPLSIAFQRYEVPQAGEATHWIGRVAGQPDSYVRFSIDKRSLVSLSGPAETRVSGVITRGTHTINLRPASGGTHLLYETNTDHSGPTRLAATQIDLRARRMEAVGRQFDLLQQLPQSSYVRRKDGTIERIGQSALSHIDVGRFRDEADFKELIANVGPYLALTGSETFKFRKKIDRNETYRFAFYQHINGVAIVASEINVDVDKDTLEVVSMSTPIVPTEGLDTTPKLSKAEAIDNVLSFPHAPERDMFSGNLSDIQAYLVLYRHEGGGLRLAWIVRLNTPSGQPLMMYEVDSNTGKVAPLGAVSSDTFFNPNTCDATGVQGPSVMCDPPPKVFSAGGCVLNPDPLGKCQDPQFVVPHETATEMVAMWDDLLGPDWGPIAHDGGVDIIVNSEVRPLNAPEIIARTVYSVGPTPWGGFISMVWITHYKDGGFPAEASVTAHEMGHVYWGSRNVDSYAKGGWGTVREKRITNSLYEAVSDIASVTHHNWKKTGPLGTTRFAKPHDWQPSAISRDLSVPRVYPTNFSILDESGHDNGRIVGHMFYRLVEDNNGVDFPTAAKTVFNAIPLLSKEPYTPIPYQEFIDAMVAAAPNNTVRNAIRNAWQAVGIGTGGTPPPPPPSTPAPPATVSGTLTNACLENDRTIYNIFWSPSNTAFGYYLFYLHQGAWLNAGGTTLTSVDIFTRIDTITKVSACNSRGCSALSQDGYAVTYQCSG